MVTPLRMILILACIGTPALGDLILSFDQATYTVAPNATVDVGLYLIQTNGESILSDSGLLAAGANIFINETSGALDPAEVQSIADIAINPDFDDPFLTQGFLDPGVSAGLSGAIDLFSPPVVADANSIYLGTFTFTAGAIAGETTSLRATDLDPGLDDTVAADMDGTVLDGLITDGFAQITVSGAAVPEPSVIGLLVCLAGCFSVARRPDRTDPRRAC